MTLQVHALSFVCDVPSAHFGITEASRMTCLCSNLLNRHLLTVQAATAGHPGSRPEAVQGGSILLGCEEGVLPHAIRLGQLEAGCNTQQPKRSAPAKAFLRSFVCVTRACPTDSLTHVTSFLPSQRASASN